MTMIPPTRVTQSMLAADATNNMQQMLARLGQLQSEISSNKRLQKPSDDPVGIVMSLRTRGDIAQNTQIGRNIDDATAWLSTADSALQDAVTQLTSARTLAIQAQNGALDPSSLEAIAQQIDAIRSAMIGIGNTEYAGRSIFAGTAAGPAYDASGNYIGTSSSVERTVAPGTRLQINVNGDTAFGAAGADVFTQLTNLAAAVRSGSPTSIDTALSALDTGMHGVQSSLADVGAREQRLSSLKTHNSGDALTLQQSLSNVEDTDLPKAVMELQMQQNAYQASLAVTARVLQPSLVTFLTP
jgi:flagellar hook-associated protein 3 FlgL